MITYIYNKNNKFYIVVKKNDKSVFINYDAKKKCYYSEELELSFVFDINDMSAKGLVNDVRFKSEVRKNSKGNLYFTINDSISLPKEEEEKINYLITNAPMDNTNQENNNTKQKLTSQTIETEEEDGLPF